MSTSFFINFDSDSLGNKNNDFISNSSPLVKFSDSFNQDLNVSDFQPQSNGLGLGVFSDDTSKLIIEPTDNTYQFESLSLVFGNDDSGWLSSVNGYNGPLYAVLEIYKNGVQVGKTTEVANGNDLADQKISAPANVEFDQVNFYYAWDIGNGIEAAPLIEVVDDITGILASVVGTVQNGTNGNDTLTGNAGNDTLIGGNGNDTLTGNAGNDTLIGGNGTDLLVGGAGDDLLDGGNGTDTLRGGLGNDTLTGGNGSDVFLFAAGEGTDTITDFKLGSDKIGLTDGLTFGQLSFVGSEISVGSEVLAVLSGVNTTTLTASNFVTV
jgi:Ca2+-binding RTX toxin-like protein